MIDNNIIFIFNVLDAELHNKKMNRAIQDIDWDKIEQIAIANKLLPFLYNQVKNLLVECQPEEERLLRWKNISFSCCLNQIIATKELKRLLCSEDIQKFNLVFFKGIAIAKLYPNPYERYSCDFDVLASEKDRDEIEKVFLKNGFTSHKQKSMVQVYEIKNKIHIEVHFSLYEDHIGRQIDILNEMELDDRNKCIILDAMGCNICTLGYEEHLIYQFFHMIKHFAFESISIRYLLDVMLFADKYYDMINWESFWKKMKRLNYHHFANIAFAVAYRYLGMEREIHYQNVKEEEIDFFIKNVLNKHELVKHVQYDNFNLISPYLYNESKLEKKSKIGVKLALMFPKVDNLPNRYDYAKKYKVLIGFAWVERMIRHFIAVYIVKRGNSTTYKVNTTSDKILLLNKLGLIEKYNEKCEEKNEDRNNNVS